MDTPFNWTCPFCERVTTITNNKIYQFSKIFDNGNQYGDVQLGFTAIICPNQECNQLTLTANLNKMSWDALLGWNVGDLIQKWNLIPQSTSRQFPNYIPIQLRTDYQEACAILNLSPKASATLSRRCLQGIIRDFWKVTGKTNLKQEIDAIQEKIEPLVWRAIDAVRTIGNIGAHMEKDVNLIVDVDPGEAKQLIKLIEFLFDKWYIQTHETEQQLHDLIALGESKVAAKKLKTEIA